MSYEFKLDSENQIIECEYTGDVTFDERMQAIKEGIKILQEKEYPRILINLVAAKMHISQQEKLELAKYISEQHALINARTAFLIRCEQTEREEIDDAIIHPDAFISQVFFSRAKALDWLNIK
jgi:uncharacterized protein GlcG (DUF336 family)